MGFRLNMTMPRQVEEVAADLQSLEPQDFDDADTGFDGLEQLDRLCEEMLAIGDVQAFRTILFHTIERLDGAELGVPGPLVHTLEGWRGGYEPFLADSVRRKSTPLSVWMVNRLLNARPPNAGTWLEWLQLAARHPLASAETRSNALAFLEYQNPGSRGDAADQSRRGGCSATMCKLWSRNQTCQSGQEKCQNNPRPKPGDVGSGSACGGLWPSSSLLAAAWAG